MVFRWTARDLPELRFAISERFSIQRCLACGTHVTVPQPDETYLADLYRRHYVPPGYAVPDSRVISESVRAIRSGESDLLNRWCKERSSEVPAIFLLPETASYFADCRRVLDVGAYTGENMLWLRAGGWEVVGLEPNPEAAGIAQQVGLDVRVASLEQASLPADSFDAAYLSYVIEHLADPRAALLELRRVLRVGGRLLITTHNVHSLWRYVFGPYWFHWHTPFHLFHTHPRSLRSLAVSSGFRPVLTTTRTPLLWLLYSIRAMRDGLLLNQPNKALYTPVARKVELVLHGLLELERAPFVQGDCTIAIFERLS